MTSSLIASAMLRDPLYHIECLTAPSYTKYLISSTQSRKRVTQALSRVRHAARHRKKEQFTALLHHLNVDTLRAAFLALKRKAAPGVDGVTWQDYEADLDPNLVHREIHRGAYWPQPSRRTYIPKADGRQRPLAVAALEDKIVQGATRKI